MQVGGRLSLVQAALLGLVSQILAGLRLGMIAEIPVSLITGCLCKPCKLMAPLSLLQLCCVLDPAVAL